MKKLTVFLALAVLMCLLLSQSILALPSETDSGILYSVHDGYVTVEGFNYAGTTMRVPKEIEGLPVKYIAPQACRSNEAIAELYLPETVIEIGEFAFAECENLTKVVMKGAEKIGFSAFARCDKLSSISLPSNLEVIDDSAFEGCTVLGKVKIPKSVTKIGVDAFSGCDRLRFDASENDYAKEYAKQYSIPTSFFETWEFTVIMLAAACAAVFALLFVIRKTGVVKKIFKK